MSGSGRTASSTTPAVTHRPVTNTPTTTTTTTSSNQANTPSTPQSVTPPVVAPDAPRATRSRGNTNTAANPIQLSDLQNFLQGIAPAPADHQTGAINISHLFKHNAILQHFSRFINCSKW